MTRLAGSKEHSLLTIEELRDFASRIDEPLDALTSIAALAGNLLEADVCSIYLLETDQTNLVLAATVGLEQRCVGRLRMGLHEGLTGLVAQELCPIAVEEAARHSRFKYFPEAGEDAYESFLGAPLVDRGLLQGVLVVQQIDPRSYDRADVRRLVEVTSVLGPVVRAARREIPLRAPDPAINAG